MSISVQNPVFTDPYTPPTGTFTVKGQVAVLSPLAAGSTNTDFDINTVNTRTAGALFTVRNNNTSVFTITAALPTMSFTSAAAGNPTVAQWRTASDLHVGIQGGVGPLLILNNIVSTTLAASFVRDAGQAFAGTTTTGKIQIGFGRSSGSTTTAFDTYTATAATNQAYLQLLPKFTPNAAGLAVNIAAMMINPVFNATAIGSGVATALAIAPVYTAWTNGTPLVIDAGTTTTDYFTGFTSLFRVDSTGNIYGAQSALATNAVNGFNYIRGGNGVPTGVPATLPTGEFPMYWDHTDLKLYIYDAGWKRGQVAGVDVIYA